MVLNVDWLLQTPLLLPRSIETQKAMAAGLDYRDLSRVEL
jgi:hypothetical protein